MSNIRATQILLQAARRAHRAAVHRIATECSGDHDSSILTRFDCRNFRLNHGGCHADTAKIISRAVPRQQSWNGEDSVDNECSVGRDTRIELLRSQRQSFAVPYAVHPCSDLDAVVPGEPACRAGPWDALVQQDSHAGASNTASERSKTCRAISRVTDGKHSRNSSKL